MTPELARLLETREDLDRLRDVHGRPGNGRRRRIVEFAKAGVPSAGVVPAVGTLPRKLGRGFVYLDREAGIELLQHRTEMGGHDPATDEDDVGGLGGHGDAE